MRTSFGWLGKVCFWASAFSHLSSLQGQAQSWQFYQAPVSGTNSVLETSFEDMEGSVFVGRRVDVVGSDGEKETRGVVYNASTGVWNSVHKSDAFSTLIFGINGNSLVGEYGDLDVTVEVVDGFTNTYTQSTYRGFLSTDGGSTLNTFNISGAVSSIPYSVQGNLISGTYYTNTVNEPNWFYFNQRNSGGARGFVHNLSNGVTQTFAISNAVATQATSLVNGTTNNLVVGTAYFDQGGSLSSRAFIYDLDNQTETLLDFPDAEFTTFFAGDNGRFVGAYRDDDNLLQDPQGALGPGYKMKGLLYEMGSNTWTSLDAPDPENPSLGTWADTWANSIQGDTIVGTAQFFNLAGASNPDPNDPNSWSIQAFVYTVPEPGSTGLLALGLGTLLMRRRRGTR